MSFNLVEKLDTTIHHCGNYKVKSIFMDKDQVKIQQICHSKTTINNSVNIRFQIRKSDNGRKCYAMEYLLYTSLWIAPLVFCIWHIAWMQKYGEFNTEKHNAQGESIDAYERSSERNQEQKFNRCCYTKLPTYERDWKHEYW